VYVKIDTGYRRAGLEYTTKSFSDLIKKIYLLETSGSVVLVGFYSHGRFYRIEIAPRIGTFRVKDMLLGHVIHENLLDASSVSTRILALQR